MSKSDLEAWPIYHHKRESIEAHLSVVMAAMAVGHLLEERSGLSLKRLVRTLRRYWTFQGRWRGRRSMLLHRYLMTSRNCWDG
jgi:putative transposase